MAENRYIIDIDSIDPEKLKETYDANSIESKKRRLNNIRNRVICTIVLVLLVLTVCGVGVWYLLSQRTIKPEKTPLSPASVQDVTTDTPAASDDAPDSEITAALNDLLGDEDEVVVKEPEPYVPTEAEIRDELITKFITTMAIEDKVAGLFVVAPEQITGVNTVTRAGEGTKTALTQYAVGGIIYAAKNIENEAQFKEVISNTVSYARYPLFLAVDEPLGGDGPLETALKNPQSESAAAITATGDTENAYNASSKIAKLLADFGLNTDFGMYADVLATPNEDGQTDLFLADKSFGTDPGTVKAMLLRELAGFEENKINTGLKFFPGAGSLKEDSTGSPVESFKSADDYRNQEFAIYKELAENGADFIMVGHMMVSELTNDTTYASRSKVVMTDIIRKELGLDEVIIITDDLSKAAVSNYYDSTESAVASLKAGADMLLCPENFEEAYNGVLEAVEKGYIAKERIDDSLLRIYRVKFRDIETTDLETMVNGLISSAESEAESNNQETPATTE